MLKSTARLAMFLLAAPVFAGGPEVRPLDSTIYVGQSIVLHAINAPGGLSSGYPYNFIFKSDASWVAEIHGFAKGSGYINPDPIPDNGDVFVTGVGPGTAHVLISGLEANFATVVVLQRPVLALVHDVVNVPKGTPATLSAAVTGSPGDPLVTFAWYRGHINDMTQPLQVSTSPVLQFVPESATTFVWVRAASATWVASAEAEVRVFTPRRRVAFRR